MPNLIYFQWAYFIKPKQHIIDLPVQRPIRNIDIYNYLIIISIFIYTIKIIVVIFSKKMLLFTYYYLIGTHQYV